MPLACRLCPRPRAAPMIGPVDEDLVAFVLARLDDDEAKAATAQPGYDTEATGHIVSEAHSGHAAHYSPEWVRMDIGLKRMLVSRDCPARVGRQGHPGRSQHVSVPPCLRE